jgi:hypothetical protein
MPFQSSNIETVLKEWLGLTKTKWDFAIGTTSIVPHTHRRKHYLIGDVDGYNMVPTLQFLGEQLRVFAIFTQRTQHGFHFYTNLQLSFKELLYVLRRIPGVDATWVGIGESRGYLYLADKEAMMLPWPVVRMVIYVNKEKKANG